MKLFNPDITIEVEEFRCIKNKNGLSNVVAEVRFWFHYKGEKMFYVVHFKEPKGDSIIELEKITIEDVCSWIENDMGDKEKEDVLNSLKELVEPKEFYYRPSYTCLKG